MDRAAARVPAPGQAELLVPPLVIEEFEHNRPRAEAAVTNSVLARLRQLRRELDDFAGEKHEHVWLEETGQHISLVNAMAWSAPARYLAEVRGGPEPPPGWLEATMLWL